MDFVECDFNFRLENGDTLGSGPSDLEVGDKVVAFSNDDLHTVQVFAEVTSVGPRPGDCNLTLLWDGPVLSDGRRRLTCGGFHYCTDATHLIAWPDLEIRIPLEDEDE